MHRSAYYSIIMDHECNMRYVQHSNMMSIGCDAPQIWCTSGFALSPLM